MEKYCTEIDSYLGNGDSRYFSQGFKHFQFDLHTVKLIEDGFTSSIATSYKGPGRPRQENPHLGSMEYSAIALYLAEVHMVKISRLTRSELARAFPRDFQVKINKEITIVSNTEDISVECHQLSSKLTLDSLNGSLTVLVIKIGGTTCKITLDHPGPSQIKLRENDWPIEDGTLYSRSYRERDAEISKIVIDEIQEQISCTVKVTQSLFQELNGLGTSFDHIILTDLIGTTGQLMQVLLFRLLKTEREKCPNIWLRSMDIKFERPEKRENYRAKVNLSGRKMLKMGDHTYHSFSVISRIGNMDARFNVCHKIAYL